MIANNPITPKTLTIHGGGFGGFKTAWALSHAVDHKKKNVLYIGIGPGKIIRHRLDQAGAQNVKLWVPERSVTLEEIEARIASEKPEVVILDGATGYSEDDVRSLRYLAGRQNTALMLTWQLSREAVDRAQRNRGQFGLWAVGTKIQDIADYITTSCPILDQVVVCTLKQFVHRAPRVRRYKINAETGMLNPE